MGLMITSLVILSLTCCCPSQPKIDPYQPVIWERPKQYSWELNKSSKSKRRSVW